MIGPFLRTVLTVAAYGLILLGFARGTELIRPLLSGGPSPYDLWHGTHLAAWAVVGGIVQSGVLLALLSIDKRIQNRGF